MIAKYNPLFEKAGMTKIAETKPRPQILKAIEKLRALGFNLVILTSKKANQDKPQKLQANNSAKSETCSRRYR